MIARLETGPRLRVHWNDGNVTEYPWVWVREHSHDDATLHPVTRQRLISLDEIDPTMLPVAADVVGDAVEVTWPDAGTSRLSIGLLADLRSPPPIAPAAIHWDRSTVSANWPSVPYGDVMADDDGVRRWLDELAVWGFCIVTGTPQMAEATRSLVERIADVRHTIFGGFWEFAPDLAKADTAYTRTALAVHTDGTYSNDAPGAQILHCLAHDGDGGASTMVDGFRIADELRQRAPEHYDTLSTVEVPGQYIGDGAHLMARRPVFRHEHGRLVQVSYNYADRAPFVLPPDEMDRFHAAIRAFEALAADPALRWCRRNPPGEAMLFDNWRVLHGRTEFTGHRHMCGAYLNREDLDSRRRLLVSG